MLGKKKSAKAREAVVAPLEDAAEEPRESDDAGFLLYDMLVDDLNRRPDPGVRTDQQLDDWE
jgi:hypothetical protein